LRTSFCSKNDARRFAPAIFDSRRSLPSFTAVVHRRRPLPLFIRKIMDCPLAPPDFRNGSITVTFN
jgi:hypothetical protein